MIQPPRLGGSNVQVLRSQLALEVALTAYAFVGAALILRLLLLLLGIGSGVWTGAAIRAVTAPLLWPLTLLPGAGRELVGLATLPDFTAVALVVLVPLALLGRRLGR